MDFKEAYLKLSNGQKIRRKAWEKSFYLDMDEFKTITCYREEVIPFTYDIDIINSDDWIVIKNKNERLENIPFPELIGFLMKGSKAKLPEWPDDCFIECASYQKELIMRRKCEYELTPTFECFSNNDWETIDEVENME